MAPSSPPARQVAVALQAKRESKRVEFKESVDVSSAGEMCELLKDVVAMANSGGGVILIGLKNDGTISKWDPAKLLALDPAKLIDKIASYTGREFDEFRIEGVEKTSRTVAAIVVGSADIPMVFESPGAYALADGKQKTAFGRGTLYFRHGAKSEPAKYSDLVQAIDRIVETRRRLWVRGIRQVVEAEPGDTIQVLRSPVTGSEPQLRGRIVADRDAIPVRPTEADSKWPHRQTDVVRLVNEALNGQAKINSFDVQAIKSHHGVDKDHPEFAYRPFMRGSPQYSQEFVDWMVAQFKRDPNFFAKARGKS